MDATTAARRALTLLGSLALAAWLAAPAAAQDQLPDIAPPGEEPRRTPSDQAPVPPDDAQDPDEWDGAGDRGDRRRDDGRVMRRRRPRLRVVPRGPDLRLEFEIAPQVNTIAGDGHDAQNLDYDDLFSGGTGVGFRAALPMRFHRTASRVSLLAGPLLIIDGAAFDGAAYTLPNNDVLIADDMSVTRIGLGGFFRADFGRFFIEPWFSIGGGHVSETDAVFDETFNGGGVSKIPLYERSTVGHVIGAFRGGITFWPTDAIAIGLFGEVSAWATGAPDGGAIHPALGDTKPGAMAGARLAFGVSISFGLGDFQGGRTAAVRRAAPARRPLGDF